MRKDPIGSTLRNGSVASVQKPDEECKEINSAHDLGTRRCVSAQPQRARSPEHHPTWHAWHLSALRCASCVCLCARHRAEKGTRGTMLQGGVSMPGAPRSTPFWQQRRPEPKRPGGGDLTRTGHGEAGASACNLQTGECERYAKKSTPGPSCAAPRCWQPGQAGWLHSPGIMSRPSRRRMLP